MQSLIVERIHCIAGLWLGGQYVGNLVEQRGAIDDFSDLDLHSFELHLYCFRYFLSYLRLLAIHDLLPVGLLQSLQDAKGLDRLILEIQLQIVDALHIQRLDPIQQKRRSSNDPFAALFPHKMPITELELPVIVIAAERVEAKEVLSIRLLFSLDHVSI